MSCSLAQQEVTRSSQKLREGSSKNRDMQENRCDVSQKRYTFSSRTQQKPKEGLSIQSQNIEKKNNDEFISLNKSTYNNENRQEKQYAYLNNNKMKLLHYN